MKYSSLIIYFLFSQLLLAQQDVFQENHNVDFTNHFESTEEIKESLYSQDYENLHRKEGFLIGDVLKSGALFDRNLKKSGQVNFNSNATVYLNDIKNYLLKDYQNIAKDINIYITFSNSVNAFTTVNKDIYFNIGLLAKVKNEAQIAYILSHEIMHVINNHIVSQVRDLNREFENLDKNDIGLNSDYLKLYQHQMSLADEFEADNNGLHLFLTSKYPAEDAINALELLKTLNLPNYDITVTAHDLYLSDSVFDHLITEVSADIDYEINSFITSEKSDSIKLSTHPDINERIDSVEITIKRFNKESQEKNSFQVSKSTFEIVSESSKNKLLDVYIENFEFISAFNFAILKFRDNLNKEENLELINKIGYSVFGLVAGKTNFVDFQSKNYMLMSEKVLAKYFKEYDKEHIIEWGINVLEEIKTDQNKSIINKYKKNIKSLDNSDNTAQKTELELEDVTFNISPSADLLKPKEFTQYNRFSDTIEGKIAFFNYTTHSVSTGFKLKTNVDKAEKYDIRGSKSILNLEKDYPDELKSLVPNSFEYNGSDYEKYLLINNWFKERLYFDGGEYVSIYEEQIKKLIEKDSISYAMASIQIEVNSFSFLQLMKWYLAPFLVPQYLPQIISNIALGGHRTYKLTLLFRLKDGALCLWDKRTSLQPQTIAQIYFTYNDVLNNLRNKQ